MPGAYYYYCLVPRAYYYYYCLVYLVHHEARAEEARALLDGHDVLEPARLVDRSEDELVHVVAHLVWVRVRVRVT